MEILISLFILLENILFFYILHLKMYSNNCLKRIVYGLQNTNFQKATEK